MQVSEKKSTLVVKNIFYGTGSKFLILVLGIIIPRIVIVSFGSELNGFLSTVTQIFTYFALLEAGIGNSAVNALYAPLESKDYTRANMAIGQARSYYRKATIAYTAIVILFAFVYPFLMPSGLDKGLMIKVILLQGAPSAISYYFCAVYEQLLMADGKRYVSENVQLILHIATSASKILLILWGFDIVAVQLVFFLISLVKIPIIAIYCKRKYPWLSFSVKTDERMLKERSAFVVHELSATIFSNTDVFVISVFCGFEMASVYTIYNMVFSALNSLLNTANTGLGFMLGRNLDKPIDTLRSIFDIYSTLCTFIYFVVMTTATILSIPFVSLYTQGVDEVNYILKWVPVLFGLIFVMSGARSIPARLISVSGCAEDTKYRSVIEMVINIVFSVVLVYFFDIYGVLLGTIIALIYRMNDIIIYANKRILKRSSKKTYACLITYFIIFFASVLLANSVAWNFHSYFTFAAYGFLCIIIFLIIYLIPTLLFEKDIVKIFQKYLKKATNK